MARLLAEGAIGEPRSATLVSWIPYAADPQVPDARLVVRPRAGRRVAGRRGVHTIDQVRTWLGDVSTVRGSLSVVSDRPADVADDTFQAELTMTSGCRV